MNSIVSAMIWLQSFSGCEPSLAFGHLRAAFQAILSARDTCLLELFHWHQVLARWPRIAEQQDAAEFLCFVLHKAEPAGYLITWEARRMQREVFETRITTTDSGDGFLPLVIDICSGGIQQCIDDWSTVSSSSIYALRCAPKILFLQLRRYTQRRGVILKSGVAVSIDAGEIVWMPLWEAGFELRYVSYRVAVAVFHLGATLQSGHYRAALSQSARNGSQHWYLTDDGVYPARAKAADLDMLSKKVYLIGLLCCEP